MDDRDVGVYGDESNEAAARQVSRGHQEALGPTYTYPDLDCIVMHPNAVQQVRHRLVHLGQHEVVEQDNELIWVASQGFSLFPFIVFHGVLLRGRLILIRITLRWLVVPVVYSWKLQPLLHRFLLPLSPDHRSLRLDVPFDELACEVQEQRRRNTCCDGRGDESAPQASRERAQGPSLRREQRCVASHG